MDDAVINGDLFEDNDGNYPVLDIMTASLGFEGINGIPASEVTFDLAMGVGGVHQSLSCGDSIVTPLTTSQVFNSGGFPVYYGDGFPIQFTYPVLVSDMRRDWVQVKLNNGTTFTPAVATVTPAADYNEKGNIVLFDPNLAPSSRATHAEVDSGACTGDCYYVSEIEIIGPLRFVGPDGVLESAQGVVGAAQYDPYDASDPEGGNKVIRAKLNECIPEGDEGHWLWGASAPPNSCADVYGEAADYRIRLFTMWGAFKEGRLPILPIDYSRYFTLVATLDDGSEVTLPESGVEYMIDGEPVTVLGLAETGMAASAGDAYDECYYDDRDNLIDVVLQGSASAVTKITSVFHSPSDGTHEVFYNPGGPGLEGGYNPDVRYTVPSTDHSVDIYDGVTGDPRLTSYGNKFGQSAVPVTLTVNGLDGSLIANDPDLACTVIGGDMQAFFRTLAAPSPNCFFSGNTITAYMPVMSVCDRDVVNAMGQLVDQMSLANTEATYGGSYTASVGGRRLEEIDLDDLENSPLGPVTCSDGVTLGWTNLTAMNFAFQVTNYLCNVVEFEDACEPVFTICPDTPFEDVVPIVINQNDAVIQCGYNGTGVDAGGCVLETSADFNAPGILVQDNFMVMSAFNLTSSPVTGITVKGMTFVNNGGTASVAIGTTLDPEKPNTLAASFDSCTFEDSDSPGGFGVFVSPPSSEFAMLGSGPIQITKSNFMNNHLNTTVFFAHNGTLTVSDTLFEGNTVTNNIIGHYMGLDIMYQNCFIDNSGPGSVFNGPNAGGYAADNYVEGNEMGSCDGMTVNTAFGARCIVMEGESCTIEMSDPETDAPVAAPVSAATDAPVAAPVSAAPTVGEVGAPTPSPVVECDEDEEYDENKGKCKKKKKSKKGKGTKRRRLSEKAERRGVVA